MLLTDVLSSFESTILVRSFVDARSMSRLRPLNG